MRLFALLARRGSRNRSSDNTKSNCSVIASPRVVLFFFFNITISPCISVNREETCMTFARKMDTRIDTNFSPPTCR